MDSTVPLIFDGHNDVLLKLSEAGGISAADSFVSGRDGHIDLDKCRAGGFGAGFFAIYVPSEGDLNLMMAELARPEYDLPLPEPVEISQALPIAVRQAAILNRLEQLNALKICTNVADIRDCLANGQLAAVMHMEGAEAIDPDFHSLDLFYRAGLRSLGPVWSRSTIFGHGVPFRYPSTGDTGPGLTDHGLRLVERCDAMGILIDLSHLTEAGFWDVARVSSNPLVATHSNCHEICPSSRNLTDRQLAAIAESDGMVGLNFAAAFLRPDGKMKPDVSFDIVLRHLDYLLERLGENRVGFGSDFDGAVVPEKIGDASGLTRLRDAMRLHGYDDALMVKLCQENWMRVLGAIWGG